MGISMSGLASSPDVGAETCDEERDEETVEDEAEDLVDEADGADPLGPANMPDRVASGSKVPLRICSSTLSKWRSGPAIESRE